MGGGRIRQVVAHGGATVFEREGKRGSVQVQGYPASSAFLFCVLEKESARIVCLLQQARLWPSLYQ